MAIDLPQSDLSRSKQHEQSQAWPATVKIQLEWVDSAGKVSIRQEIIEADSFFGRGGYGAPLSGEALIQTIERMRRAGPPEIKRKGKK